MQKVVFLDNIRSQHNVGSIFRTSDGAGVSKIYLGGYTPAPIDRFGREVEEIKKTSLGASRMVPWEKVDEDGALAYLAHLKQEAFHIVAVEQDSRSVSLYDFKPETYEKVCYILGNEVDGVRPELLDLADTILEIPMAGQKESLNVSVTTGIVLFYR